MNTTSPFPGNRQHQALLNCIVDDYQNDPRILAVIVFGSLGRGNWDDYSDLDLDIITSDEASIDVFAELRRLGETFAAINERVAILIPDENDAGDMVLESLMQLSIRYHPLADTSPNIVESMRVLLGSLDPKIIVAAGNANRSNQQIPLNQLMDQCVRYVATANVYYQRKQIWGAVEVIHRIRNLLMEIFARTHGGQRGFQTFGPLAEKRIQERLGATLPRYDYFNLREALIMTIDVLEDDLDNLADGQCSLNISQKIVLNHVRQAVASS